MRPIYRAAAMARYNPTFIASLANPGAAPVADPEHPNCLLTERSRLDMRCYLEDALCFSVSSDFDLATLNHRYRSIYDTAERGVTRSYAPRDITVWREHIGQATKIALQSISEDRFMDMSRVRVEQCMKRNIVQFLVANTNRADEDEVFTCYSVDGASSSVPDKVEAYIAKSETPILRAIIYKVLQVLIAFLISDKFAAVPLTHLRNADWRIHNLWKHILDRPTMYYIYEHFDHVLDLPLIFNVDESVVIGHETPPNTKANVKKLLEENCMFGMDLFFNLIGEVNFAATDRTKKIPLDTRRLCNEWRSKSLDSTWFQAMQSCRKEDIPTIKYVTGKAHRRVEVDDGYPEMNINLNLDNLGTMDF